MGSGGICHYCKRCECACTDATPAPPVCALCIAPLPGETMEDYVDRHYGLPLHPLCACGASGHVHTAQHPHGCPDTQCPGYRVREET